MEGSDFRCFSSVFSKAAGEEKRRFLSSFRMKSVANCSPEVAADSARNSEYRCRTRCAWRSTSE